MPATKNKNSYEKDRQQLLKRLRALGLSIPDDPETIEAKERARIAHYDDCYSSH